LPIQKIGEGRANTAEAGEPCQGGNAAAISHKLSGVLSPAIFYYVFKNKQAKKTT